MYCYPLFFDCSCISQSLLLTEILNRNLEKSQIQINFSYCDLSGIFQEYSIPFKDHTVFHIHDANRKIAIFLVNPIFYILNS